MINLGMLLAASSPVARDHWGIFELIIKESGDEGRDGKERKSPPLFFSFPTLPGRALRSFPSSLPRASRLFRLAWLACSRVPQSSLLACLFGGGGPQLGEATCGGSPHLSCKHDQIKMRDYVDRRVTHQSRLPHLPGVPHLHVNRPLALEKPVEKTVLVVQTNFLGSTFNSLYKDLQDWPLSSPSLSIWSGFDFPLQLSTMSSTPSLSLSRSVSQLSPSPSASLSYYKIK